MEWTKHDSASAQEEGWDIFLCHGSQDGEWQIQRLDEERILDSDERAWELVGSQKTEVQKKALAFIRENNPKELRYLAPYLHEAPIPFHTLGINLPFRTFVNDTVYVKIDESRYIQIGVSGSKSVQDRETLIRPL